VLEKSERSTPRSPQLKFYKRSVDKKYDNDDEQHPLRIELVYRALRKLKDYLDFFKILFLHLKSIKRGIPRSP